MTDPPSFHSIGGALTGAMISGFFGLGWSQWGASGIAGPAGGVIRVAGLAIGLTIICSGAWLRRSAAREQGSSSIFFSPAYRVVVALEVVAIIGGNTLLGATGHSEYIIACVATVVGVHFLVFGRLFWTGFYWLGAALIAAGIAGAAVGLAGGSSNGIEATAGLIAAVTLLGAGGSTVLRVHASTRV